MMSKETRKTAPGNSLRIRDVIAIMIMGATVGAIGAEDSKGASIVPAFHHGRNWVEPMKEVHRRFKGQKGTFAQFGDSITFSMAFWAPLAGSPTNLETETSEALPRVKRHMNPDCWTKWKGPNFGNNGSMTVRWADANIEPWLDRLEPEVAVLMFGSNDVSQMDIAEYGQKTRRVVMRLLERGTIVLLTTAPPRSGYLAKSVAFADVIRGIARDTNVPLIDYFGEIIRRRPDDWDGSLGQFKESPGDGYQVPTLIARDGVHPSNPTKFHRDYSQKALNHSGFALRNYLTLLAYSDVIREVLNE